MIKVYPHGFDGEAKEFQDDDMEDCPACLFCNAPNNTKDGNICYVQCVFPNLEVARRHFPSTVSASVLRRVERIRWRFVTKDFRTLYNDGWPALFHCVSVTEEKMREEIKTLKTEGWSTS